MYGILRDLLNPGPVLEDADGNFIAKVSATGGFGIPAKYAELRRQLAPMPLDYDGEGRMYLPPKNKPTPTYKGRTIRDLIGRSPDHADSLVLAVFGLVVRPSKIRVGVL